MPDTSAFRLRAGRWIESKPVQRFIITLILLNAVTLGMETSPALVADFGPVLLTIDAFVLSIFVIEIGTKLVAFGPRFFRDPWNVFDFAVVAVALVPASGPLAVLRTLRVLRVLRLVSVMPKMRLVVQSLLHAVPGIGAIAGLMLLLFYVAAVMATGLYGSQFPDWFGSIGASMYTLFQVMTLESWSMGIARPVMEAHPYAWIFFIPFILVATFTMLNLFIAIIVNTMQEMHEADHRKEQAVLEKAVQNEGDMMLEELRSLRKEVAELRRALTQKASAG